MIESVPIAARRSAFLTYEHHQAFHRSYLLEMRRRTAALVAAFYSSDAAALLELRDKFGVDAVIVEPDIAYRANALFVPYDGWIAAARRDAGGRPPAILHVGRASVVETEEGAWILDLHALEPKR